MTQSAFPSKKPRLGPILATKAQIFLCFCFFLTFLYFNLPAQASDTGIEPDVATSGVVSFIDYCADWSDETCSNNVCWKERWYAGEYPTTDDQILEGTGGGTGSFSFCNHHGTTSNWGSVATNTDYWGQLSFGTDNFVEKKIYLLKKVAGYWYSDVYCGFYSSFTTCELAGCCWTYLPEGLFWSGSSQFCTECPTGECANNWLDCQNCTTQENCENEGCFWYFGSCRYGQSACAGTSLGLCTNETDCENAGGYWYDDFCWYSEKPDYFTSWSDWYDEHGNYATPTAFVGTLASSTQGFFEIIGGFFSSFSEVFNLTEAYDRGIGLGSSIPKARGYLDPINQFIGGFLIAEILIFILIFGFAIGIIRIMTKLFSLVKFW